MTMKSSAMLFGCLMLLLSPLASKAATSSFIHEDKINGISFASGGVGMDERMGMDELAKNYNIKMVFVEAPRDYVSGVKVKIEDPSGKTLLETTAMGPWFFAKLPQGDYRIEASFHNHREIKDLKVTSGFKNVEFFWKS